jgi:divalent metal cation (Fe/Co/Zn/Cd) transporter
MEDININDNGKEALNIIGTLGYEGRNNLEILAYWAKILSFFGFATSMLLGMYGFFTAFGSTPIYPDLPPTTWIPIVVGLLLIGFAVLAFTIAQYQHKTSVYINTALKNNSHEDLSSAFGKIKSIFRIQGIIMLIYICIIGFMFIQNLLLAINILN